MNLGIPHFLLPLSFCVLLCSAALSAHSTANPNSIAVVLILSIYYTLIIKCIFWTSHLFWPRQFISFHYISKSSKPLTSAWKICICCVTSFEPLSYCQGEMMKYSSLCDSCLGFCAWRPMIIDSK